ncbi:hypothetical protein BJ165DRAFT_1449963 [Panaeolus papilionaceus]|nr:hypothetical protein BJ165DRAFT_1449963 [Panaeolus papilionaceus]
MRLRNNQDTGERENRASRQSRQDIDRNRTRYNRPIFSMEHPGMINTILQVLKVIKTPVLDIWTAHHIHHAGQHNPLRAQSLFTRLQVLSRVSKCAPSSTHKIKSTENPVCASPGGFVPVLVDGAEASSSVRRKGSDEVVQGATRDGAVVDVGDLVKLGDDACSGTKGAFAVNEQSLVHDEMEVTVRVRGALDRVKS